ncbi:MAG TPA: SAM-dependent methyltransferase [Rhodanobacteraceae bacterium]|nr:SAM-dependent methyltransferase [Rhodanobacteraceae bacterium]
MPQGGSLSQNPRGASLKIDLPIPDADESAHSAALALLIRNEITAHGAIPFSRYMELCLYAPGLGYYSAGKTKFGAAGDFVTAPELGDLFARCVAGTLAPALQECGDTADFVELGGGSGRFAVAALRELATQDALPHRYRILEPSADLRERQRVHVVESLPHEIAARVEWIDRPPESPWNGVLFANEVLDALPTTRFAINGGNVYEECITLGRDDAGFVREDRPADALVGAAVRHVERYLEAEFVDGYRSEILPQLPYWMPAVIGSMERGVALFVDYGYPRSEFYLPERNDGTLVCHYRHRAHADPLFRPGLQDITAFVDFTAVAEAGTGAGFELVGYAPQSQFLLASGLPALLEAAADLGEVERMSIIAEAKRLTLPGEMGERFQAIAFSRGVQDVPSGLRAFDLSRRL